MHVLVVGGSGAVGAAVVRELIGAGDDVAWTWRTEQTRVDELKREFPAAHAVRLDLLDASSIDGAVDEAVTQLGGLDALVFAAAPPLLSYPSITDLTAADFDLTFTVAVRGAFLASRSAVRHLGDGGNIVLVGSVDGVKALPTPPHHAAGNGALAGLARSMAKELGPSNIRVNLVAAGLLDEGRSLVTPADLVDQYERHSALRRRGTTTEAAVVIAWLARSNTYLTGRSICVDGGL